MSIREIDIDELRNHLKKSVEYNTSAEILLNNRKYNSSIHCSYYSFLKISIFVVLMNQKSLVFDRYDIFNDENEIKNQDELFDCFKYLKRDDYLGRKGFHQWLLNLVSDLIKNTLQEQKYKELTIYLKNKRNLADYSEKQASYKIANNCNAYLEELKIILLNHFNYERYNR